MSHGKKYNIWIAYSDLFTNLSTFLFISALGVFAALGSGRFATPGLGAQTVCSVPAAAEESLLRAPEGSIQPASLVRPLRSSDVSLRDCVRYYRLGRATFRGTDASLANFMNPPAPGVSIASPMPPVEIRSRICQPIWLLISRRDFREHDGRVVLLGIPTTENNDLPHPPQCEQREEEPKILYWGVPRNRRQMDIITVCEAHPQAYSFCPSIRDCLRRREGDRNSPCQRVVAVVEWNRRATLACTEQAVRQQARAIHRLCEGAPSSEDFQDQLYRDQQLFVEEARYADTHAVLWEQVGFDAHMRSSGRQPNLDALPAGAIALEVRYNR